TARRNATAQAVRLGLSWCMRQYSTKRAAIKTALPGTWRQELTADERRCTRMGVVAAPRPYRPGAAKRRVRSIKPDRRRANYLLAAGRRLAAYSAAPFGRRRVAGSRLSVE